MSDQLVLKWAYRYHHLEVEPYDDIEDAMRSGWFAAEDGQEAFECIEVFDADGSSRVLDDADVQRQWAQWSKEDYDEYRSRPDPVAEVIITATDGTETSYSTYQSLEKAEARAAEWRPFLGDRVRARRIGEPRTP